jgi:hypothetical protein
VSESFNEDNKRRLCAYIGEVRSLLRMDDWDVLLHAEPVDPDIEAHAETWASENHRVLNIRIDAELFDLEPAGIRNTVIHELTHAQHRDADRLLEDAAEHYLPKPVGEFLDREYHVVMERFVSWITDRIEDTMPPWRPRAGVPKELPRGIYLHTRPS